MVEQFLVRAASVFKQGEWMSKVFPELDDDLRAFISRQHVFFVATAPLSPEGHVNLSPKGLDSFRVLGPQTVAYLDLTGSGVETIAHVRENGRLTEPKVWVRLPSSGRKSDQEKGEHACSNA
jgi:hypothetical protein